MSGFFFEICAQKEAQGNREEKSVIMINDLSLWMTHSG